MVSLEDLDLVWSEVRVDEILISGRIVVHIMQPSVPPWCDLLSECWEQVSVVGVLDPSSLVVSEMIEVFVVSVSMLIGSDERSDLFTETSLLVRDLVDLTSEEGSHEPILSVDFGELRPQHSNVYTPRSHFNK